MKDHLQKPATFADDEKSDIAGTTICFTPEPSPSSSPNNLHLEEKGRGAHAAPNLDGRSIFEYVILDEMFSERRLQLEDLRLERNKECIGVHETKRVATADDVVASKNGNDAELMVDLSPGLSDRGEVHAPALPNLDDKAAKHEALQSNETKTHPAALKDVPQASTDCEPLNSEDLPDDSTANTFTKHDKFPSPSFNILNKLRELNTSIWMFFCKDAPNSLDSLAPSESTDNSGKIQESANKWISVKRKVLSVLITLKVTLEQETAKFKNFASSITINFHCIIIFSIFIILSTCALNNIQQNGQLKGLQERFEKIEQRMSAAIKHHKEMEKNFGKMQDASAALKIEFVRSKGDQAKLTSHMNSLLGRLSENESITTKAAMAHNELEEKISSEVNVLNHSHEKFRKQLNKLSELFGEVEKHYSVSNDALRTEIVQSKGNEAELQAEYDRAEGEIDLLNSLIAGMEENEAELRMNYDEGREEIDRLKSLVGSMELWSPCTTNEVAQFHGYENRDAYGAGWCRDNGYEGASPKLYPHGYRTCREGGEWHQFRCANTSSDLSDTIWSPCYRNEDATAMGHANGEAAGKSWCAGRQRGYEFTTWRKCGNKYYQYKCR